MGSKSTAMSVTDNEYGMFTILVPVCIAPALAVLFWGQRRAKKLGALNIADEDYAKRQVAQSRRGGKTVLQFATAIFWEIDIPGLILLAFALGCFLIPFSLAAGAEGGYANRK